MKMKMKSKVKIIEKKNSNKIVNTKQLTLLRGYTYNIHRIMDAARCTESPLLAEILRLSTGAAT